MNYNLSSFSGDNKPVEQVTWYDAVMYVNELSKKEGLSQYYTLFDIIKTGDSITSFTVTENASVTCYRLPTEEQWVYAARGGNKG